MSFWFSVLLFVGFTILGELLRPKPKFDTPQPSSLGDFQLPTAEEGRAIPVVWGTCHVKGPNVLWYGGLSINPITKKVKTGLFSKTTVTTGYKYFLTIHVGICHGAIGLGNTNAGGTIDDTTFTVVFDERIPTQSIASAGTTHSAPRIRGFGRTINSSTTRPEKYQITINAPSMFGGDEKEGGVSGVIDVYTGGLWYSANDHLLSLSDFPKTNGSAPAYRGIAHAVLRNFYVGTSPYIKPISFIVTRCPSPKRFIDGDTSGDINASIRGDANPAYMLLEILTDNVWGLGRASGLIDLDSFYAAAITLKTEELGMSMMLDNPADAQGVIADILRHIDGVIYTDPSTGLITLKLIRDDYDPDTLPVFDESNIDKLEFTRGSWSETKNIAKILYIDAGRSLPDSDVLVQANYETGSAEDISLYDVPATVDAGVTLEDGVAKFETGTARIVYSGFQAQHNAHPYTLEAFVTMPPAAPGVGDQLIFHILGDSGSRDWRIIAETDSNDVIRPRGYFGRSTATFPIGTGPNVWTGNVEHHLCFMYDADTQIGYILINGVLEAEADCSTSPGLPSGVGELRIGSNVANGTYTVRQVRLSLGFKYERTGFTPPSTLPDPSGNIGNAKFLERPVQWQNLANVESRAGQLAGEVIKFHGFSNADNANKAAARVGKTLSYPLSAVRMVTNRDAWQLRPGSVFKLNWPPLGITGMICRIGDIKYGELLNNRIDIDALEDIFGLAATAYTAPPATTWSDTTTDVAAPTAQAIVELPYHFINADDRYVATLATRSSGLDIGYEVWSDRSGDTDFDPVLTNTIGQFVPSGVLSAEYAKCTDALDATGFSLTSGRDLNLLSSVTASERDSGVNLALIRSVNGDEFVAWQTVSGNSGGSSGTFTNIVRGALDTLPLTHPAGSRVWFFTDGFGLADELAYPDDRMILAKLLPFNGTGTLAIGSATQLEVTLDSRALKPYPPGNVRVNGIACPSVVSTDVIFTWSHRHRVTQTEDQVIVHQDAGDYVAEPEGDYRVEIIIDGEVIHTFEDFALSSDGYQVEYTMAQRELDHTDPFEPVTFRITPINDDGLEGQSRDVTFLMGQALLWNDYEPIEWNDGTAILLNG
jgi:hypothetical protein